MFVNCARHRAFSCIHNLRVSIHVVRQELCDEGSSLVDETSDDMNTDRELRARAVSRDLVCVLRGEKTAHHTGPSLLPKAAENPP